MKSGQILVACAGNPDTLGNVVWAVSKTASFSELGHLLLLSQKGPISKARECFESAAAACATLREFRELIVDNPQGQIPEAILGTLMEFGKTRVAIDLTTGQKPLSASLYAAASYAQIPSIFYISPTRQDAPRVRFWEDESAFESYHLEVVKPLDPGASELAAFGLFEVHFAGKDLDILEFRTRRLTGSNESLSGKLIEAVDLIRSAYSHYLSPEGRFREACSLLGLARESIHQEVISSLEKLTNTSIGTQTIFENWPSRAIDSRSVSDPRHYLLANYSRGLRLLRNYVAHNSKSNPSEEQTRVALASMITVIEVVLEAYGV